MGAAAWQGLLQQQQQQQQQQAAMAARCLSSPVAVASTSHYSAESFDDMLRKMPRAPSYDDTAGTSSHSDAEKRADSAAELRSEHTASANGIGEADGGDAPSVGLGKRGADEGADERTTPKRSRSGEPTRSPTATPNLEMCVEELPSENGCDEAAASDDGSATGLGGVQMSSQLLEASANAWALLSNQWVVGELLRQANVPAAESVSAPSRRSSTRRGGRPRRSASDRSLARGRAADGCVGKKSPSSRADHVDDTIDSVIRQQTDGRDGRDGRDAVAVSQRLFGTIENGRDAHDNQRRMRQTRDVGDGQRLRVKSDVSDAKSPPFDIPLDLSTKPSSAAECERAEESASVSTVDRADSSSEARSSDTPVQRRKRRLADAALVRVPLRSGWVRQTCVRSVSASGVRGDVIYYAPCGKRLGSYAEVIRYLHKNSIGDIGREHFSFSCKVLVGDFLQIQPSSSGNVGGESRIWVASGRIQGIRRLTEDDVLHLIEKLGGGAADNRHSLATIKSEHSTPTVTENGKTSDSRRKENGALNCSTESTLLGRADAKTEANDDITQQQLAFLQKQGEEYYRQLLLVGLEQEKMRQQVLTARAMEVRHRAYAERVIRQEEREASKSEQLNRLKQLRLPMEDLELNELKVLPQLEPIADCEVPDEAFADLLMVYEFVHNFGHVLKIEPSNMPSLAEMHAGAQNDADHVKSFRKLTKLLLTLVLEFPGVAPAAVGRAFGPLRDVRIVRDNYSELLRVFLAGRDRRGRELALHLRWRHFEALEPTCKAAVLAFLSDELLYCRNVVREIETNIEDVARLKGDKWAREGKIRLLRGMQAFQRVEAQRRQRSQVDGADEVVESEPTASDSVQADACTQPPASPHSTASSNSGAAERPPTEAAAKDGEKKAAESLQSRKIIAPGCTQPDPVTDEEKLMSSEQLDSVIERLSGEAAELRDGIERSAGRVRGQMLGQDRFERSYWNLAHCSGLVVESRRSGSLTAALRPDEPLPALDRDCTSVEPEVSSCVALLVDRVANADLLADKPCNTGGRTRFKRSVPPSLGRGWWRVGDAGQIDRLRNGLQTRGIRERNLHRSLTRLHESKAKVFQGTEVALAVVGCSNRPSPDDVDKVMVERVGRLVNAFEEKVIHANIHKRFWSSKNGEQSDDTAQTLVESAAEDSRSSWSSSGAASTDADERCFAERIADLKRRLSDLEANIERRYLKPPFRYRHTAHPTADERASASPTCMTAAGSAQNTAGHAEQLVVSRQSSSEVTVELAEWREAVAAAENGSQLTLCLQRLDQLVSWDKSAARASCQMCRGGGDECRLLLCDGCDRGYHTYCFKASLSCTGERASGSVQPAMTLVPAGDWFCPMCVATASGLPCCAVCYSSSGAVAECRQCHAAYHAACAPDERLSALSSLCTACQSTEGSTDAGERVAVCDKKGAAKASSKCAPPVEEPLRVEELCSIMLAELDSRADAWPFKLPVDTKALPLYKKVIKKPIDLSVIDWRLQHHKYESTQQFADDVKLMFDNCNVFNEDDSAVGKAGHSLRRFFARRWKQLRAGATPRSRPRVATPPQQA